MRRETYNKQSAATPAREQDPAERIQNFCEVSLGYTLAQAREEATRCMQCKNKPCVASCPVGIDIPAFIHALALGHTAEAYATVKASNYLPAICGRVCPQETQCQGSCTRKLNGEAVAIGRLERFLADWALEHPTQATQAVAERVATAGGIGDARLAGRKVALIGSGPASLTCAAELASLGCDVWVYEALHELGGVLVYGIPEFRLPNTLVAAELQQLEHAGVHFVTNAVIGKLFTLEELMSEKGFEAVFIGTGAGLPRYLGIPGEGLNGVSVANELLTRVNLMHAYEFPTYATPVYAGKQCIVVGGGNVAMDAARTARRLGCAVTVLYRRGEQEMPARLEEREHAKQEGVEFRTLANPVEARGDENGWIRELRCQTMRLGPADESGRQRAQPVNDADFTLSCDMLVVAIGSNVNPLISQTTPSLESDERNLICVDAETAETSMPGVFAGGDATTGAATVILAMGAGKRAARAMARYLETH